MIWLLLVIPLGWLGWWLKKRMKDFTYPDK